MTHLLYQEALSAYNQWQQQVGGSSRTNLLCRFIKSVVEGLPGSAQGPHPTSAVPPTPTIPRVFLIPAIPRVFLTPTISHMFSSLGYLHHRKARGNPSVGVGGAWEVGWGPCADPGGWASTEPLRLLHCITSRIGAC